MAFTFRPAWLLTRNRAIWEMKPMTSVFWGGVTRITVRPWASGIQFNSISEHGPIRKRCPGRGLIHKKGPVVQPGIVSLLA